MAQIIPLLAGLINMESWTSSDSHENISLLKLPIFDKMGAFKVRNGVNIMKNNDTYLPIKNGEVVEKKELNKNSSNLAVIKFKNIQDELQYLHEKEKELLIEAISNPKLFAEFGIYSPVIRAYVTAIVSTVSFESSYANTTLQKARITLGAWLHNDFNSIPPACKALFEVFDSIFDKKIFHISRDNYEILPEHIRDRPYYTRPASSLTDTFDFIRKIQNCILNVEGKESFQIATLCHPKILNKQKGWLDKLFLSYDNENKKFLLTVNDKDFFNNIEELWKNFEKVNDNKPPVASNQFSTFSTPSTIKQRVHSKNYKANPKNDNPHTNDLQDDDKHTPFKIKKPQN